MFYLNAVLFGIALAMDAFSVSMANGLNEPNMKQSKMMTIALTFGVFQYLMPIVGWVCVHTIVEKFTAFQKLIPWIALLLLSYIGGKMLKEGIKGCADEDATVGFGALFIQGIATSIDALSVGFTIADLGFGKANLESIIIGVVTFMISYVGIIIGKKFGTKLSNKAAILGGVILIAIGIEIFVTNL